MGTWLGATDIFRFRWSFYLLDQHAQSRQDSRLAAEKMKCRVYFYILTTSRYVNEVKMCIQVVGKLLLSFEASRPCTSTVRQSARVCEKWSHSLFRGISISSSPIRHFISIQTYTHTRSDAIVMKMIFRRTTGSLERPEIAHTTFHYICGRRSTRLVWCASVYVPAHACMFPCRVGKKISPRLPAAMFRWCTRMGEIIYLCVPWQISARLTPTMETNAARVLFRNYQLPWLYNCIWAFPRPIIVNVNVQGSIFIRRVSCCFFIRLVYDELKSNLESKTSFIAHTAQTVRNRAETPHGTNFAGLKIAYKKASQAFASSLLSGAILSR